VVTNIVEEHISGNDDRRRKVDRNALKRATVKERLIGDSLWKTLLSAMGRELSEGSLFVPSESLVSYLQGVNKRLL
jgi:hypothetical protein